MTTPALKEKMLQMLDEARLEVESGDLESLVLIGRRRHTGSNMALIVHDHGADTCSLLGFAILCIHRMVATEQDHIGEEPQSMRVIN